MLAISVSIPDTTARHCTLSTVATSLTQSNVTVYRLSAFCLVTPAAAVFNVILVVYKLISACYL